MDQSPDAIRNITLWITFTKSGYVVGEGVDWYWFTTGTSRMVRKGVASVQENWRTTSPRTAATVFKDIGHGAVPQILVFRQVLLGMKCSGRLNECTAADNGFARLIASLRSTSLAAPYYVVVAGAKENEGVVITRSHSRVDSELRLGTIKNHPWYLLQTNYDQCAIVPSGGNTSTAPCVPLPDSRVDPRRTAGENTLASFGSSIGATQIGSFAVLSAYPVMNPHTAFTVVMSAATGTLTPFIRIPMCPEHSVDTIADERYCNKP